MAQAEKQGILGIALGMFDLTAAGITSAILAAFCRVIRTAKIMNDLNQRFQDFKERLPLLLTLRHAISVYKIPMYICCFYPL